MRNFNDTHPEIKENEVFVFNIFSTEKASAYKPKPKSEFLSVRTGEVAYDCNGNVVENHKPLFAIKKNKQ